MDLSLWSVFVPFSEKVTFPDKNTFQAHLDLLHEGKRYMCSICDYKTEHKKGLEVHVLAVHEKKKPFKCEACNKDFSQKPSRDWHFKRIHGKLEKNFTTCPFMILRIYGIPIDAVTLRPLVLRAPSMAVSLWFLVSFNRLWALTQSSHKKSSHSSHFEFAKFPSSHESHMWVSGKSFCSPFRSASKVRKRFSTISASDVFTYNGIFD